MAAPTGNDFIVFHSINDSDKFRIIKEYLWLGNTISEVGREVFPYDEDRSAQEKVSVVIRCYGFVGQNYGVFGRWGIAHTMSDSEITAFIISYPNGCRYDDNGAEMNRFLEQSWNTRMRQRKRAALEDCKTIAAEVKRQQEEIRRQQEEVRRKALSIAQEAEELMSKAQSTQNYEELYAGIEKYRQAMAMYWKELTSNFWMTEKHIQKSDVYLTACAKAALNEYENKNYPNVLKYCNYAYDLPQAGAIENAYWRGDQAFERTDEYAACLSLMLNVYLSMNNVKEAIHVAKYGFRVGSIRCMEILGDYYSAFSHKEDVLLACFYFESACTYFELPCITYLRMDEVGDRSLVKERLLKKRKCAQDKVVAMRADEVEQVMNAYSPDWLPSPQSDTDTWETYSNLPNCLLDTYDREAKNKNYINFRSENAPDSFKRSGYVPGQIDLCTLWDAYRAAHPKITEKSISWARERVCFGELLEGDFVECCRYLWEKKYG